MAKVRLKSKQWANFSSYVGVTKFEKGVSVDHVSAREAQLLGSIMAVEIIEDDGSVHNGGLAQMQVDGRGMQAPVEKKKLMASDTFNTPEEAPTPDVVFKGKEPEAPSEEDKVSEELEQMVEDHEAQMQAEKTVKPQRHYERDELEAIADESGITSLREIGENLGVKSNSIESLIHKILKAQRGK
jgi:hypothetical protein